MNQSPICACRMPLGGWTAGLLLLLTTVIYAGEPAAPAFDPDNAFLAVKVEGFFSGKKGERQQPNAMLNMYLVRVGGRWISGVGTATNNGRPHWNVSLMPIDPAGLAFDGKRLTGTASVLLAPDPWIPTDHRQRTAVVTLDATVVPDGGKNALAGLAGAWTSRIDEDADTLIKHRLFAQGDGTLSGGIAKAALPDVSGEASYSMNLTGLIPGRGNYPDTRRSIVLGVDQGQAISARMGMVDIRHTAYDFHDIAAPEAFVLRPDGSFTVQLRFDADTLDGAQGSFAIAIDGTRVNDWIAGTWKGTCTVGGTALPISGCFRGGVGGKAYRAAAADDRPWFVQDPKIVPFNAGEHPRLFFRKADVPELRRRAATPEGQRIVARLRRLLNGSDGESMPTSYNPAGKAYESVAGFSAVDGTWTISHGAGFGFLYHLTGESRYADLARQCVEKAFAGQRDRDGRYAWVAPGGELRAGPSIGWTAVAYDLCYDAWPEEVRTRIARAIQDYADVKGGEWNKAEGITLRKLALTPNQGPASNHYGAVVGGTGLAVLAIMDDPGTDNDLLTAYWRSLEKNVVRHVTAGWGDGGYYSEGWGASRVGTQGGFLCLLQAVRTATGRDYLNGPRPNMSYVTMVPRSLMVLGPAPHYPYRSNMGGTYGSADFGLDGGFSFSGYFAEGFGAVAERDKPALLWTYNHVFDRDAERRCFDTANPYPHRAMLALINWPTFAGIDERNPEGIMPKVVRDHLHDYAVFRNRWQDADDLVTTVLLKPPKGTNPQEVMVWGGGGLRLSLMRPPMDGVITTFAAGTDGSGMLTAGTFALAVDYSRASGADALIASLGASMKDVPASPKMQSTVVQVGGVGGAACTIVTIALSGNHPTPTVDGTRVLVGSQSLTIVDGGLRLDRFTPEASEAR